MHVLEYLYSVQASFFSLGRVQKIVSVQNETIKIIIMKVPTPDGYISYGIIQRWVLFSPRETKRAWEH